jgi:hypothetical protein
MSHQNAHNTTTAPWGKMAASAAISLAVITAISLSTSWRQQVVAGMPEFTLEQVEMFTDTEEDIVLQYEGDAGDSAIAAEEYPAVYEES